MAYSYNEQSAGTGVTSSKFNAATAALGRVTDVGLYPIKPAKFIVTPISGTYYVFDGESGQVTASSSSANVAVQNAVDGLTAGRSYKEKIVVQGDMPFTGGVLLDDYTVLEIQGRIYANEDNISNLVRVNGKSHVEILGGVLVGRYSGQSDGSGIAVFGASGDVVEDVFIHDIYLKNFYYNGILINSYVKNVSVDRVHMEDCNHGVLAIYSSGVSTYETYGLNITNIQHYGTNNNRWAVSLDRYIMDANINNVYNNGGGAVGVASCKHVNVSNCISVDNANNTSPAFNFEGTGGFDQAKYVMGSNLIAINATQSGFQIANIDNLRLDHCYAYSCGQNGFVADRLYNSSLSNCLSEENGRHGFSFWSQTDNYGNISLFDCFALNNNQDSGSYDGISCIATLSGYLNLINCSAKDDQGSPTQRYGMRFNQADVSVEGRTDVSGNATADFSTVSGNIFPVVNHSNSLDLSGSSTDLDVYHATSSKHLVGYIILYTEASSANEGVKIRVGRYQDGVALEDDYFDEVTSEESKAKGYSKQLVFSDLTQTDISSGDTVTVGTVGGKTGTGEVLLFLQIV